MKKYFRGFLVGGAMMVLTSGTALADSQELFDQGIAAIKANRNDDGISKLNAAIVEFRRENPSEQPDTAYYFLGKAYSQKGDYLSSKSNYEKAIEISDSDPRYRLALAYATRDAGNKKEACKMLDTLLIKHKVALLAPDGYGYQVYNGLGMCYMDEGRAASPTQAARDIGDGRTFAEDDPKGDYSQANKLTKKAIEAFSLGWALRPSPVSLSNRAWAYKNLHPANYASALADYETMAGMQPSAEAYRGIAGISDKLGQYKKAIEYYGKAIDNGGDAQDRFQRAECETSLGQNKAALADYKAILAGGKFNYDDDSRFWMLSKEHIEGLVAELSGKKDTEKIEPPKKKKKKILD